VVLLTGSTSRVSSQARRHGAGNTAKSAKSKIWLPFDHGGWLPRVGINRRTVRWILGNPLIAITMIRHDITAGLSAPVEVLVTEKESGPGTTIAYVRPSSLMVIEKNPPLREAAKALDEKFDALIAKATGA
jgi:uncharacterized protein (DUF302 family)